MFEPILTANIHRPDSEKIAVYLAHGGYEAARLALTQYTPEELIDMVKRSGLRGRGGAGFPAGIKWGFMPKDPAIEKIVAVNTDEGEPGTFKDRQIVECDPHSVIEGVLIAILCRRRQPGLRLHPRRVLPGDTSAGSRPSPTPTRTASWGRTSSAVDSTWICRCIAGQGLISAGKRRP